MILTEGQIKAHVREIRKSANPHASAFALRSPGPWSGPTRLTIDGVAHRVSFCRSDLELRELLHAAAAASEPLVVLCPFDSEALGEDVLARLAKRRVHPPLRTELVASLFQASVVDPRILANAPLTTALIEQAPSDGYPPVVGGALDLQTAWREVLGRALGERDLASSLSQLLQSSLDPGFRARLEAMSPELRREFFAWATQSLEPSANWMACLVTAGKTADLIALGLLLELLFSSTATAHTEISSARVRLEGWFAGKSIDLAAAQSWSAASRSVVHGLRLRLGTRQQLSAVLGRFDELLTEFRIPESAAKSDFSPMGFEQRLALFAGSLVQSLKPTALPSKVAKQLISAINSLQNHLLAGEHQRRIERCQMAARLACWLCEGGKIAEGTALEESVEGYVRTGGFLDWARTIVQEGDSDSRLNKAYDALLAAVGAICDGFEANFATRLADWTRHEAAPGSRFLPIEEALETLVGPIAAQVPVLLLVMDGMSMAVFRELIGDIAQRGNWLECQPLTPRPPIALMATVPSITEISRRALFRGKLHPESTPTEQSAFTNHDRLFSLCGGQTRPVLYLKGGLQEPGEAGLSEELKEAIGNKRCRVVATVLNAVDDHLSGADQISPRWDLDFIKPLRELLQAAAEAGRAVILTSDHGHLLDQKTSLKSASPTGGDRYRTEGIPGEGEVLLSGPRVQRAVGRTQLMVAWARTLRYSVKKRGYHGGANPMEMVIPFAILVHRNSPTPTGWQEVAPSPCWPDWWKLAELGEALPLAGSEAPAKLTAGLDLFAHAAAKGRANDWIEQLLDGELYAERSKLAVRGVPERAQVALFLETLSARGGTMPREALAERMEVALLRLNGWVPNVARILNVDGYEVVGIDNASGTISLNVALLKQQFFLVDSKL